MPRIRSLKPEALQHRKVGRLSDRAFRLWVACLTQADDYGRLIFDPGQFRLLVWGYHDAIRAAEVLGALRELVGTGLVRGYLVDKPAAGAGTVYLDFPSWQDHQKVDHARKSGLPAWTEQAAALFSRWLARPRAASRAFASLRGGSIDRSRNDRSARAREGKHHAGAPVMTRGSGRSSVSEGSSGGEGDPLAELQAPAGVGRNGHGPLAGTVAHVLASLRPVGFVPRDEHAKP
jgi:hypothetical protein